MRDADVIVVGAGAGGPIAARALSEAGVSVLMLDAGPWLDPDRDYSQIENDMFAMPDGKLRWGPADRSRDPWQRKRIGVSIVIQSAGVGGCTRHYNGIASRAIASSIDDCWPLAYDELIPSYEQVEHLLPVHRVSALAPKDARFAQGCRALAIPERLIPDITAESWGHSHNAILPIASSEHGDGCTLCGHCLIGCGLPAHAPRANKAKRATDVSMVPAAVATGCCEVVADAFATKVLVQTDGRRPRAAGVRWRDTRSGAICEARSGAVVLAAGSIETPRLWLNSGLPDRGAVGRYLTCHYPDAVTGFFDDATHPDVGQVTMAKADFPGRGVIWSEGFAPWGFGAALTTGGASFWDETPVAPGEPWDTSGRAWGADALRQILRYQHAVTVAISTDDEALAENRVQLAGDWPADEHGPVASVEYRPSPLTRERRDALARKAASVLRAAGATEIHRAAPARAVIAHAIGTMRMSIDPRTGVVAPSGDAHDVDRLFLADASVLSNGIGGAPPSLTTQTLAWRTAQQMLDRYADELRGVGGHPPAVDADRGIISGASS
jgi:choline dehydrogenase-like flavoprotein